MGCKFCTLYHYKLRLVTCSAGSAAIMYYYKTYIHIISSNISWLMLQSIISLTYWYKTVMLGAICWFPHTIINLLKIGILRQNGCYLESKPLQNLAAMHSHHSTDHLLLQVGINFTIINQPRRIINSNYFTTILCYLHWEGSVR